MLRSAPNLFFFMYRVGRRRLHSNDSDYHQSSVAVTGLLVPDSLFLSAMKQLFRVCFRSSSLVGRLPLTEEFVRGQLFRVVRTLWPGCTPLLGQDQGNGARTARTASMEDDASYDDGARGEANDDVSSNQAHTDRADGRHNRPRSPPHPC